MHTYDEYDAVTITGEPGGLWFLWWATHQTPGPPRPIPHALDTLEKMLHAVCVESWTQQKQAFLPAAVHPKLPYCTTGSVTFHQGRIVTGWLPDMGVASPSWQDILRAVWRAAVTQTKEALLVGAIGPVQVSAIVKYDPKLWANITEAVERFDRNRNLPTPNDLNLETPIDYARRVADGKERDALANLSAARRAAREELAGIDRAALQVMGKARELVTVGDIAIARRKGPNTVAGCGQQHDQVALAGDMALAQPRYGELLDDENGDG